MQVSNNCIKTILIWNIIASQIPQGGKLQTAILESFKIQGGGKIPLYKDLNFRAQKLKDFNLLHISRSFFCTNFREITCVTIQGAKQLQLAEFCKLLYAVPRKD